MVKSTRSLGRLATQKARSKRLETRELVGSTCGKSKVQPVLSLIKMRVFCPLVKKCVKQCQNNDKFHLYHILNHNIYLRNYSSSPMNK